MKQVKKTLKNQPNERTKHLGEYAINGGPGRPKGSVSGRKLALRTLDSVLADSKNLQRLRKAMQTEFDKGPTRFFKHYVIPLRPKEDKDEPTTPVITYQISERYIPDIYLNKATKKHHASNQEGD